MDSIWTVNSGRTLSSSKTQETKLSRKLRISIVSNVEPRFGYEEIHCGRLVHSKSGMSQGAPGRWRPKYATDAVLGHQQERRRGLIIWWHKLSWCSWRMFMRTPLLADAHRRKNGAIQPSDWYRITASGNDPVRCSFSNPVFADLDEHTKRDRDDCM